MCNRTTYTFLYDLHQPTGKLNNNYVHKIDSFGEWLAARILTKYNYFLSHTQVHPYILPSAN